MRRALAPLALCSLLLALAVVPAGHAALSVGISDQQASTFTNPLYAPLKMRKARYITPYDVMSDPVALNGLRSWVSAASAAHQRILVAFEHSHRGSRAKHAPSVKAYTRALKKFKAAFPQVREISAWNEVNRKIHRDGGSYQGQPIWNKPKKAAQYYMAARKVFKGAKIVALDILDQANVKSAVRYVKRFRHYARPAPRIWGIHPYSDNNRFSTKRTRALLRATGHGEVWLTEAGGIVKLGSSFPYSPSRAAKAIGCTFKGAKSNRRITRVYIYQFNGAPPSATFDAGLIGPDNSPRPGYTVVLKRKARRCHK